MIFNNQQKENINSNENIKTQQVFCNKCLEETIPQSTGNLLRINFVGTSIKKIGFSCKICNSLVAEKRFVLYGIPIYSFGYYRIQSVIPNSFYARRLTDQKYYAVHAGSRVAKE